MTRPDPVLEKWLQEQERKLLRAQTDMTRIMQEPRRGSAGEALLFNAVDLIPRPFDPTTGINDWPMGDAPAQWSVELLTPSFDGDDPTGYIARIGYGIEYCTDLVGVHVLDRVPNGVQLVPDFGDTTNHSDRKAVWRKTGISITPPDLYPAYNQVVIELAVIGADPFECHPADFSNGTEIVKFRLLIAHCDAVDCSTVHDTWARGNNVTRVPLLDGSTRTETDDSTTKCYNYYSRAVPEMSSFYVAWHKIDSTPHEGYMGVRLRPL